MQRHRGVKEHGLFQERGEPQAEAIRMNHGRNEAVEAAPPNQAREVDFPSVEGDLRRWPRAGGTQTACGGDHGLGLGA